MPNAIKAGLLGSAILALGLTPVHAQDDGERELPPLSGFSVIPFSFGPPGARALGMGGAFIAIADDATASEANPAGLTLLFRPEVSIHGRHSSASVDVVDFNALAALEGLNASRFFGPPLAGGDTVGNAFADPTEAAFDHSVDEISFASYVKPFEGYTFSVYFQRSADFSARNSFRAFDDGFLDIYQTRQELTLSLESLGISAAFKAGNFLSVGFSLRHSRLELDALQESRVDYFSDYEFRLADPDLALDSGATIGELQALPLIDFRTVRLALDDSDGDITFNVGLLINPNPNGKWSLGLVYKDGGEYEIEGLNESIDCQSTNGLALPDPEYPDEPANFFCDPVSLTGDGVFDNTVRSATERIKVPDFFGVGLAWRPTDRLKLALDVTGITYSDLDPGPGDEADIPPEIRAKIEQVEDEYELHFGTEYTLFLGSGSTPLTLRGGFFTDPDHDGFREIDSDETVVTLGLGTVVNENVQIDLAGQFSGRNDVAILSLVYRF